MEKAKDLLTQGSLEESCRLLTEFIETRRSVEGPENTEELSEAFNTRGQIRYLWVDFDEAVQDYTEAIRRSSHHAVAYYNRGQVHYRLGTSRRGGSLAGNEGSVGDRTDYSGPHLTTCSTSSLGIYFPVGAGLGITGGNLMPILKPPVGRKPETLERNLS